MNPLKEIRINKKLTVSEFAKKVGSNPLTINNVEKGECLYVTYLTIIRKTSLVFDDVDDGKLIKKYENWLKENNITEKNNNSFESYFPVKCFIPSCVF